jgi:predicted lysophospholipase L1 biosynthesis ABC-type transport system permease subunit
MALTLLGLVVGQVVGLAGAYMLTRFLESWIDLSEMLYGVHPSDPLTYGQIVVLLMLAAVVEPGHSRILSKQLIEANMMRLTTVC